jgi:hypothetical protein
MPNGIMGNNPQYKRCFRLNLVPDEQKELIQNALAAVKKGQFQTARALYMALPHGKLRLYGNAKNEKLRDKLTEVYNALVEQELIE